MYKTLATSQLVRLGVRFTIIGQPLIGTKILHLVDAYVSNVSTLQIVVDASEEEA